MIWGFYLLRRSFSVSVGGLKETFILEFKKNLDIKNQHKIKKEKDERKLF